MDFSYISCVLLIILPIVYGQDAAGQTVEVKVEGVMFERKEVNEGTGIIYKCEMTPKPEDVTASMKWLLNGEEVSSDTTKNIYTMERRGKFSVKVEKFSETEAGNYTCVGTYNGQSDSKTFRLFVYKQMKMESELEQFGIKGQPGKVECKVSGNPEVQLFWTLPNGDALEQSQGNYAISKEGIDILEVSDADKGVYMCEAEQLGSTQTHNINYEVVVPASIDSLQSSSNMAVVGKELKIECLVQGDPTPTIQIKRGEVLLDNENGVLTIKNLTQQDEANYTCVAINKGGQATKTQFFDVKVPPKVNIATDKNSDDGKPKVEGQSGEAVNVECTAVGDPAPSVAWEKNNEKVPAEQFTNAEAVKNGDGTLYTVVSTLTKTLESEDAAVWTCVAEAANVGKASKEVLIDVQFAAKFKEDNAKEVFSWIGATAALECKFEGNPLPNIAWYGSDDSQITDGVQPTVNNKAEYLATSVLEIPVLNETAFGEYKCRGINSVNSPNVLSEGVIALSEAEKPSAPSVTESEPLTSVLKFKISAPEDDGAKGPKINSYTISYNKEGGDVQTKIVSRIGDMDVDVELTSLTPDTSYAIKVVGESEAGIGAEYTTDLKTASQSVPIKMVFSNEKDLVLDSNSLKLEWKEPDNGGANITKFTITWVKVDKDDKQLGVQNKQELQDNALRSFEINNLEVGSKYLVTITATNKVGPSAAETLFVTIPSEEQTPAPSEAGSASLGSGVIAIIIIVILLVVIVVIIVVVVARKKPQLVERLRGGASADAEGGAKEGGNDQAEEEKLIKNDDAVKVENEIEQPAVQEVAQQEFEPDNKPDVPAEAPAPAEVPAPDQPLETEIKSSAPEVPDKPDNPTA